MCLVKSTHQAAILATIYIGLNNFFSGLIVRPQHLSGFFEIPYWITPGHYVFEGIIVSQFEDDDRMVIAEQGSAFWDYLRCDDNTTESLGTFGNTTECFGTAWQFVDAFFGEEFSPDNRVRGIVVLTAFLIFARALTFFCLRFFNHQSS